jgi:hypothetical protein
MIDETKKTGFLPTLALLLAFVPAVVAAVLIVLSMGGNWAFLILALIVSPIAEVIFGGASLVLGILSIRKDWVRRRGIAAVILSAVGLTLTVVVVGAFGMRGLLI